MLSPETVTLFEREAEAYFKKPKRESPFDCLERFIMRRLFDMYVQVHSYLVLSLSVCLMRMLVMLVEPLVRRSRIDGKTYNCVVRSKP
jgi:hypothetical protein